MSNRRAQDERIEGTPDGVNAITEIVDVPDAPIIGTATAGIGDALVAFTPATTGGTVSLFTATSNPGSITGTSATSPITVSGLTGGTEYTFTVSGENSTGTSPLSSASNSITAIDLQGDYDALATVTLSTATASIEFAGIPSGYKHLQLRFSATTTRNTYAVSDPYITLNGDTTEGGSNYTTHYLRGDGATAQAGSVTPGWRVYAPGLMSTNQAAGPAVGIIDILDYSDSTKYTTVRWLGGFDTNGTVAGYGGFIGLVSGAWKNTAPVNSIQFSGDYVPYLANSKFSLYGVK